MPTTPTAPPSADAAAPRGAWRPEVSRIVLRRPKGNRRVHHAHRLPSAKEMIDGCGRALRKAAPALVGLLALGAFGGAAAGSYHWVTSSPRFAITSIELRGTQTVPREALAELLPVRLGDNIFSAPVARLERALVANPWIASAKVHRELPHRLVVTVQERSAAALVDLGGLYLVEHDGQPFKRAVLDSGEADDLPVISGIERLAFRADPEATARLIRAGLDALARWHDVAEHPRATELAFDSHRGITLHLSEPAVALHLGAFDAPELAARMALFQPAWQSLSADERARTRTLYLDAGSGQAIVAFAKD